jgi:O-antigen ligase
MFNKEAEKTTSLLILIGAPLTTLFLITKSVTDPVNVTKLFVGGGLGFSLLFIFLFFNFRSNIKIFKLLIFSILFFILSAVSAVIQSDSPFEQNLYGAYGRNTGLIAYLALSFMALGALNLREVQNFKKIIWGLLFAGVVNVVYCAWVLVFGDFLSWSNPYGKILGLFGNPDFISAFLGIFISSLAAYAFTKGQSWKYRATSVVVGSIAFFEVHRSHAIQGTVVTVAGLIIVGFYFVRSTFSSEIASIGYLALSAILGVLAIFGTLQRGPLDFVYKRSVSLRGTYWKTAMNIASERPLSGAGMDAYGDWYRRARPPIALVDTPGINTVSNASHNVILDFLAYGGWPLFISYLAILITGAIAIIRLTLRKKSYDGVFVTMATAWICYQLQSIISINQIGLAVWGWLLTGALVAYEFTTRTTPESESKPALTRLKSTEKVSASVFSPQLVAGLGIVIGLLIACPPFSADSKWRTALDSRDANKVMQALEPGYLNPSDSQRFAQATQLLANSNLMSQAHEVALLGVAFNPDSYDSWRNLFFLSNSTPEEKAKAVENLKRLDPLNPDVTKP